MQKTYKRLLIIARDPATEIWVGDDEGNFVQTELGKMDTSLLPGRYTIEFGLGAIKRFVDLQQDVEIHEEPI
jgi:hypothetical protein